MADLTHVEFHTLAECPNCYNATVTVKESNTQYSEEYSDLFHDSGYKDKNGKAQVSRKYKKRLTTKKGVLLQCASDNCSYRENVYWYEHVNDDW